MQPLLVSLVLALPFVQASPEIVISAERQQPAAEALQLTFGVYQTDKATEMYRKFIPTLEYLQETLSKSLQRDVDIHLEIFKDYDQGLDAIVNGEVDFVRFGPASYVLTKQRETNLSLLAREEKKGKTIFHGVIFAREDSPIRRLQDLKGHSFAFGDSNSTIGRYLAQEQLLGVDLRAEDLSGFSFLGRHDKVVRAVQMGDADAGSAKESTFKKLLSKDKPLRVIARFENVTKPWIARAGLPSDQCRALTTALLGCKDETVKDTCGVTGFVVALDEHYDGIRNAIDRSADFDRPRPK